MAPTLKGHTLDKQSTASRSRCLALHTPDAHKHWPLGCEVHVDGGLGFTVMTFTRATQHVATLHVWPGIQRAVELMYPAGQAMFCDAQYACVATHSPPAHLYSRGIAVGKDG